MKLRWPQQARFNCWPTLVLAAMLVLTIDVGVCAQQSTEELAAAAQNPIAAMYSLPFQNNIYGGAGPRHDATANVLNIQPVIRNREDFQDKTDASQPRATPEGPLG